MLLLIRLSGALEGDYVVLAKRPSGVLRIAPVQTGGAPVVVALEKTCTACPSQWEGTLGDGRTLYVRYRGGALSVGVGQGIDEAVRNSSSAATFFSEHVGDGLDGFMDFEELRTHLYGLLDFPESLEVKNEREPSWDLEAFEQIFAPKKGSHPSPTDDEDQHSESNEPHERLGAGLRESQIQDWTCFSCGERLTQAHEGDYFHTDSENKCRDAMPVPTSLVTTETAKWGGAPPAHESHD